MTRRDFASTMGCGAFALASGLTVSACAEKGSDLPPDLLALVNPELRPFVDDIRHVEGSAAVGPSTLDAARAGMPTPEPLAAPAYSERMVPGQAGEPNVRIYVINAGTRGSAPRPAILHMHGGGFVMGSARGSIPMLQGLASELDCVIVTVEYRLAPETRFPHSLEDNYAALRWLHANAHEFGADADRIALMGESAGGGHAAMLAIAARDRGEVPLIYQALVYPMLDDRTGSTHEPPRGVGFLGWGAEDNRYGWTSLLGVPAGSAEVPNGSVPARVEDVKGLPPAFIGVGSIDLFFQEDVDYARRLEASGVPVQLQVVPGAFHGFDVFGTPIGQHFRGSLVAALKRALRRLPAA